ncbi:MAG: hypothetical protein OXL96_16560, partial [Candidatus Poribacteria bacterium]|nr:hypothetical protein [Candidatus Poribacteria bacterium]
MRLFSRPLVFLMLLSLFTVFSYADDDSILTWYENHLQEKKDAVLIAARGVDLWDGAMDKLGSKYSANKAAIQRGSTMTVASAFGVGVTAFASGGQSVAWAAIVSAVTNAAMTSAERYNALYGFGGQSLLSGYESAISSKISALSALEGYIAEYNAAYTAYSAIFDDHDVWDRHEGSGSPSSIHNKADWISDWKYDDSLPSFVCGGSCGQSFSVPTSSHWIKCGYRNSVLEHPDYIQKTSEGLYPGKVIKDILKVRPAAEGCGRHYFNCEDEAEHQLRTCTKQRKRWEESSIVTKACGDEYRRCMGQERDHDPSDSNWFKVSCSDVLNSSLTENPVVSPPPTPTPTPPPSPTYHACGVHETSVSGDHSLQASCSSTDSNGNYCTVTNFYACDSHTHSYPAPPPPPTTVSCARAACGEQVSDRLKHRVD